MKTLSISLRQAKAHDAAAIAAVHESSWREAYQGLIPALALQRMINRRSPRWWDSALRRGRPVLVLDVGDKVIGYISYGRTRSPTLDPEAEIDELYLLPEYQGLGFGKRLFRAARRELREHHYSGLVVWALEANDRACTFYERRGGRRIATVKERIGQADMIKVAFAWR